jgi:hypothetical protein
LAFMIPLSLTIHQRIVGAFWRALIRRPWYDNENDRS